MNKDFLERSEHYDDVPGWLKAIAEGRMLWDSKRTLHFNAVRVLKEYQLKLETGDHWCYAGDEPIHTKNPALIIITGTTVLWKKRGHVYFCAPDAMIFAASQESRDKARQRSKQESVTV